MIAILEENNQLVEFEQGGDVGGKQANPISEIEHLLSEKTFTRVQSIRINELLRSQTPELSTLEAIPYEERQESGRQTMESDMTISASAVKPMMRKRKMSSLDDDFESSEPQRKIPRWTISECTTVPLTEKSAFQIPISEELFDMDDDSVSLTEEPAFRMAIPEEFLEIDDDEDNSCDTGLIATSLTVSVLEKPSFQMTAPEDLSESDDDECDLNDSEFSFHVSHTPQTEKFVFASEQCWHPALRQHTSL